ncbi:MAG: cytochrome c oxidase accessory protein CcoG [Pseudomonadota bacterium]
MSAPPAPSLYAAREPIFPKAVSGRFRRLKWAILVATLAVYYITPWLRWDRGPYLPDQAVLIDLAARRFYFFMIEIWPHEFYYVAGLLIMAGIGLFLFTSVLGRVWCGYACPQTVWVDLFMHVERFIEGDRNKQIRLQHQSWTPEKIRKRTAKWTIWLAISMATGGAWIFYFADAPSLAWQFITGAAPSVAYATVAILTATTFILGGFLREQVCLYMCPWPRIQAAMLDENSLTVTYKDWRGEPRGKHKKQPTPQTQTQTQGDCIDCNACVNVCPTGVDIRKGQQLGCITCALCIDACDDIMARLGRPRGLIDYCSLADEHLERSGQPALSAWRRILRPRVFLYTGLWAGIGLAMVVTLFLRDTIGLTVRHDRNPLFVTLSDGSIRNGYEIRLLNQEGMPQDFRLSHRLEGAGHLRLDIQGSEGRTVEVAANTQQLLRVFLTSEPWIEMDGQVPVRLWVENLTTRERAHYDTVFYGGSE